MVFIKKRKRQFRVLVVCRVNRLSENGIPRLNTIKGHFLLVCHVSPLHLMLLQSGRTRIVSCGHPVDRGFGLYSLSLSAGWFSLPIDLFTSHSIFKELSITWRPRFIESGLALSLPGLLLFHMDRSVSSHLETHLIFVVYSSPLHRNGENLGDFQSVLCHRLLY